jgi:hypothetical protein
MSSCKLKPAKGKRGFLCLVRWPLLHKKRRVSKAPEGLETDQEVLNKSDSETRHNSHVQQWLPSQKNLDFSEILDGVMVKNSENREPQGTHSVCWLSYLKLLFWAPRHPNCPQVCKDSVTSLIFWLYSHFFRKGTCRRLAQSQLNDCIFVNKRTDVKLCALRGCLWKTNKVPSSQQTAGVWVMLVWASPIEQNSPGKPASSPRRKCSFLAARQRESSLLAQRRWAANSFLFWGRGGN